ncbi:MAG: diguanylate cyclase [Syntrophales bacterium]|nr:diguanylate cyclase [Syntrophales bacterium]
MALSKNKIKSLVKTTDMLCASFTLKEAYEVMGRELSRLFEAGAFYRFNALKSLLELVVSWGYTPHSTIFTTSDCLAIRRSRPHLVAGSLKEIPCGHCSGENDGRMSMCLPMNVHGEFIGLLHFRSNPPPNYSNRGIETFEQLCLITAQQIRLALMNLKLREDITLISTKDPLTGLVNRRHVEPTLELELRKAKRQEKPVGMMFIDIDHLGRINRNYGFEEGERIIKDLAALLNIVKRDEDIACRWGADEFIVILPGVSLESTKRRAENIREMLKDRAEYEHSRHLKRITLSIGVAAFPEHGETAQDLIQSVRLALEKAKREGRDRVTVAEY